MFDPVAYRNLFIETIHDDLPEELRDAVESRGPDGVYDYIHEFVDGWVPVYTVNALALFGEYIRDIDERVDLSNSVGMSSNFADLITCALYNWLYDIAMSEIGETIEELENAT